MDRFPALRHVNFARFLTARVLATLAVQMQSVAIGWQVYAITGDPLDLGLIGLAQFLPFVILVLPAGQVADRFNRRSIVAVCYATEVLCVLVLFGSARAFAMPASQALTPNLVPRAAFGNAVAINSSALHVATIIGPSFGGLLYITGASNELGDFESGITASAWGVVPAVMAGGVATLMVTGLWMRLFPTLRKMNRFPSSERMNAATSTG